jgi:signal transduction histidine kinase
VDLSSAGPSDHLAATLQATGSASWSATDHELRSGDGKKLPYTTQGRISAEWTNDGTAHVAPCDISRMRTFLVELSKSALPASADFRIAHAGNGRAQWVRMVVLSRTGRARSISWSGIATDITPLKQAEQELLQISEREQNRIGQDLHDDLCQVLAGLSCLTRVLENRLAAQVPHEIEHLQEINRQLVETMDRTRALTHGLYPAKLRLGDARPALLELAKQVEIRFGVQVKTSFKGRLPQHSANEILHVYRIAQEAISNAVRHGKADRVDLLLHPAPPGLCLTIRDNGTGFPTTDKPTKGIGLQIMQHRAAQIGAKVSIGNAPRKGAQVTLQYQPAEPS